MPFMKVAALDPICPTCIKNTKVELISGSPCTIKVHVVLSPPPGGNFPESGENVTSARLIYNDDDGNTTTQELGPPVGPAYSTWDAGKSFTISFSAASWLTQSDFAGTTARLEITTDRPRTVRQKWFGVV